MAAAVAATLGLPFIAIGVGILALIGLGRWRPCVIIALLLLPLFAFGADGGTNSVSPQLTATVTDDAIPANWFDGLIPLAAPMLIALIKWALPRVPSYYLPWLAPLLGAGVDWIGSLAGLSAANPVMGALLGASGVAVREALDQAKKRMAQGGSLPSLFLILLLLIIVITAPAAASKSALAKWKATQSDKTQGASVGSLDQEADASKLLDAVIQAAVKAGAASMKP